MTGKQKLTSGLLMLAVPLVTLVVIEILNNFWVALKVMGIVGLMVYVGLAWVLILEGME